MIESSFVPVGMALKKESGNQAHFEFSEGRGDAPGKPPSPLIDPMETTHLFCAH